MNQTQKEKVILLWRKFGSSSMDNMSACTLREDSSELRVLTYGSTVGVWSESHSSSKCAHLFRTAWWTTRAEVLMTLFCLAHYLPGSFLQNLLIEKVCLESFSEEACQNITLNSTVESVTQQTAIRYLLYYNLTRQVPSIVFALFVGHWSDIYGRKLPMLLPCIGNALCTCLIILNYYCNWPAKYLILAAVPAGMCGSYGLFMQSIFGFIKDINVISDMSFRISLADGIEGVTSMTGRLIGGQVYIRSGYIAVFVSSVFVYVLAMILGFLYVRDLGFKNATISKKAYDLFQIKSCLENFKTIFTKRTDNRRKYLLLSLMCIAVISFTNSGYQEIIYFYTRIKFGWDIILMNYFDIASGGFSAVGHLIICPILVRHFLVNDMLLGILGSIGFILYYFGTILAQRTWHMFVVSGFQIVSSLCYVTFRSFLTKCVFSSEVGKVMAVCSFITSIVNSVGESAATQIYNETLNTLPETYYIAAVCLLFITLVSYTWIFLDMKRRNLVFERGEIKSGG